MIADASDQSVEEVVIQSLRMGMPPSLRQIPPKFHDQLLSLNGLSDGALLKMIDSGSSNPENSDDVETMKRAYAFSLLKWRGHPVPNPAGWM